MKTIILGPPGTGKTTTLLNLVDEFIKQGIKPREIGYFSFSKKAATEAATRAAQKFELSPEHDLVYFRTIHSLCFKLLSMTRDRMMSPEDYKEFGIKCNCKNTEGKNHKEGYDIDKAVDYVIANAASKSLIAFLLSIPYTLISSIRLLKT